MEVACFARDFDLFGASFLAVAISFVCELDKGDEVPD